jgi:hypothetical protein
MGGHRLDEKDGGSEAKTLWFWRELITPLRL